MKTGNINVLLADDDTEDLELIEESLLANKPESHIVKTNSGIEVMSYLEGCATKELPCLIILDYNMPIMSGAELLAKLSDEPRYESISKIVLSTSANQAHIDRCLENGAMAYFVKPNTNQELIDLTKKMLEMCGRSSN